MEILILEKLYRIENWDFSCYVFIENILSKIVGMYYTHSE